MADPASQNGRAMLSGAVTAILLLILVALAYWLALTAGSAFESALLAVLVAISLAIIAGFFTAGSSSIIGFVTRWKGDLAVLFPPPVDDDDLLRDTRRTRDAFLTLAILGIIAIFIYALQWKTVGFAQVFGSALMIALAALGAGVFLGFLFGIPRTLSANVATVAAPPPPSLGSAGGSAPIPSSSPLPPTLPPGHTVPFGINTNLEEISDWLTKIIVGLGLINLGKIPGLTRSFIKEVAPSVGGQYGFALAVVGGYAVCGFMLGYLMTRLYLTRAFVRAFTRSAQAADVSAGIEREVNRVGMETASGPSVGPGSDDVDPVSPNEKFAAARVKRLAEKADTEHLRAQVEALAREYESVRAAMEPGPARTKAMEVVATKMRTLMPGCGMLMPILINSHSPGQRLAAISYLEAQPSREYLDWLGERFSAEMPFVLFHAAWALRHAARRLPVSDLDAIARVVNIGITKMSAHPTPDANAFATLNRALKDISDRRKSG
jgi:hypothetical protein